VCKYDLLLTHARYTTPWTINGLNGGLRRVRNRGKYCLWCRTVSK